MLLDMRQQSRTSVTGAALLWGNRPDERGVLEVGADTAERADQMVAVLNEEIGYELISTDDVVRLGLAILSGEIDPSDLDRDQREQVQPLVEALQRYD